MPAKTRKQRRAMYAAAAGKSNIGIPKSVGKEFTAKDKAEINGAGLMLVTPDDEVLFLLRSPNSNNPNMWDLPGGKAEDGETAEQTAERESSEEIGASPYGELSEIANTTSKNDAENVSFITFRKLIRHKFVPMLDKNEHVDYRWATLADAPEPLHPGVREVVDIAMGDDLAEDGEFNEKDHPRAENGQFGSGSISTRNESKETKTGFKDQFLVPQTREEQRKIVREAAENFADRMRKNGFDAEVQHSGSSAGSSSYVRIYDPETGVISNQDIRFSDHSKGPHNAQLSREILDHEDMDKIEQEFLSAREKKKNSPAFQEKEKSDKELQEKNHQNRVKSANKKLEKGKGITNSEKEALEIENKRKQASDASLAFDRASVRSVDQDGRMRVEISHISKAMVCPYLGEEIPDYENLGLDAKTVYMLLRDPEELEKSVSTWNSVPLLNDHIAVSAEDHQPHAVVGATGTDAAFNAPYLDNSLVIWAQDSIDKINSGEQQEISCAYYYTPDMTPGKYEDVAYDGVMRNIRANHVAIVAKGRAGPDVLVNDSLTHFNGANNMGKSLSKKAILAKGALLAHLKPAMLASDAHLDLNQLLSDVKRNNWLHKKPGIVSAIKPHLAKDASIDQVIDLLDKLDGMDDEDLGTDDDMADAAMDANSESILSKLRGKLSDEDLAEIEMMLKGKQEPAQDAPDEDLDVKKFDPKDEDDKFVSAKDEDDKEKDKDKEDKMDKKAMDRAIKIACDAAAQDAERKTIARLRGIAEAEELVRPYVGKLTAMDSADEVFKAALIALNVDVSDLHPSAYRTVLKHIPNPNSAAPKSMASDRSMSPTADIYAQFPDLLTK